MLGSNNGNVARLAEILDSRIRHHMNQPDDLQFGSIQTDGGLKPDGAAYTVPKGRWLYGRSVSPAPKSGDRVAIAWIGGRPFIMDVVVSS